jgi:aryl-alcohol dehydrogenase-like predicted oxidoreductase
VNLGLGTVQFGMTYGISNQTGRVSEREAAEILELAARESVSVIDTAPTYGECEALLGRLLPQNHGFRIATKTAPIQSKTIIPMNIRHVRDTFSKSLENLQQSQIDCLLVHHSDELLRPGGELLVDLLQDLTRQNLVKHIGISVYTAEQIDRCLAIFKPGVVQAPINVLDQRLIRSGHLAKLKSMGIEIMARSAFLQGLLLMDFERMTPYFHKASEAIQRFRGQLARAGASSIEGALHFLKKQADVGTVLVGVAGTDEFRQIVAAWKAERDLPMDLSEFAVDDEAILNPSRWP